MPHIICVCVWIEFKSHWKTARSLHAVLGHYVAVLCNVSVWLGMKSKQITDHTAKRFRFLCPCCIFNGSTRNCRCWRSNSVCQARCRIKTLLQNELQKGPDLKRCLWFLLSALIKITGVEADVWEVWEVSYGMFIIYYFTKIHIVVMCTFNFFLGGEGWVWMLLGRLVLDDKTPLELQSSFWWSTFTQQQTKNTGNNQQVKQHLESETE